MKALPRSLREPGVRFALFALLLAWSSPISLSAQGRDDYERTIEPILINYCFDCHGDGASKGGFDLEKHTSWEDNLADREHWIALWENARAELMPPPKKKKPSAEERKLLLRWIERQVFQLDPNHPDPGRVTARRLNREEYQNTIQDLFGHYFDARDFFPPDDSGYGFDNNGDVLTLSPLLLQKYLEAAQLIVDEVVSSGPVIPDYTLRSDSFRSEDGKRPFKVPFDQGAAFQTSTWEAQPGRHSFTAEYRIHGADEETDSSARLIIAVNGKETLRRTLAWGDTSITKGFFTIPLRAGKNEISLTLEPTVPAAEGERLLALELRQMKASGPLDGSHKIYPSHYRRIFFDGPPPTESNERHDYRKKLLTSWSRRILRRPPSSLQFERMLTLAASSDQGKEGQFEIGIAHALTALLASPAFLFRTEAQPQPDDSEHVVTLDEFALATRLASFFWSSTPDEQLLQLASRNQLREQLQSEMNRMLEDGKAARFVRNFTGQWLQTRDLSLIHIDPRRALGIRDRREAERHFGYRTKEAFREETEHYVHHMISENRPVHEFLRSSYTFLNEDLAKAYGIPGVAGKDMRKVNLPADSHRGGLLTQGSVLYVTSNPTRTSPVKRGLFVLENFLGTPAPPAPEEVPSLEEQMEENSHHARTMRELMVAHREDPLCASCHRRMDPIGLALENFNALGLWRDEEQGKRIDASGQLITGETFQNIDDLTKILAQSPSRRNDFYRCLTEKTLTYALGRGMEYYDATVIRSIAQQLETKPGMREFLYAIITSAPFQKRRGT